MRSRRCSARSRPRRHHPAHGSAPSPFSTASAPGSTVTPICTQPSPTASSCRDRTAPTGHRPSCPPDHTPRPRRAALFSVARAPPAILRPAALCTRAALRDPRRRRPYQSHPLRAPPTQGGQLGRARPLTKVHAAWGERDRRTFATRVPRPARRSHPAASEAPAQVSQRLRPESPAPARRHGTGRRERYASAREKSGFKAGLRQREKPGLERG